MGSKNSARVPWTGPGPIAKGSTNRPSYTDLTHIQTLGRAHSGSLALSLESLALSLESKSNPLTLNVSITYPMIILASKTKYLYAYRFCLLSGQLILNISYILSFSP